MTTIRSIWQAAISYPTSWEEGAARLSIPITVGYVAMGAIRGAFEPTASRVLALAFAGVLLYTIRQRDRARAEVARLRGWQP